MTMVKAHHASHQGARAFPVNACILIIVPVQRGQVVAIVLGCGSRLSSSCAIPLFGAGDSFTVR